MPLHSILGYIVVFLSALGFALALVALLTRSAPADRFMYLCFIVSAVLQIPVLVTGVVDNAVVPTAAPVAPFNFFVGASLFTLTCSLAAWRWANPGVVWGKDKWLTYQASALGNLALSIALIWLGRLALGG